MRKIIAFLSLFLMMSVYICFAGNTKLMKEEHQRVLMLNQDILKTFNNLPKNAVITLKARIKKMPSGKIEILIDKSEIQRSPQASKAAFMGKAAEDSSIEYVTFKEIPATNKKGERQ